MLLGSLAACATSAAARDWLRPVDGSVVRAFSVSALDRFAAGQHRGIDLAAPPGSPVRAACGGRVSFAGRVPGGGRTVSVRCGALVATYQHLGSVAVARGQAVISGGRIGRLRPRPAGAARPPRRPRRGNRRVPRSGCPLRRRAARTARAGAGVAAGAPGLLPTGSAPARAGAGARPGARAGPAAAAGGAAALRHQACPPRPPRPADCRGRCGSGSGSSRSACRSAAGSWWRAGLEPARRRGLRAPRRGVARRPGSLSGG